jgi:Trk K+ transport system NAD-binding subunit
MIKADDEVVVFATVEKIDELQKLLKAKRSYF